MTPEERKIDELLTKAFNDFYDYITEKDIVKVAHEYSEKTVYKTAKASLLQMLVEARIDEILEPLHLSNERDVCAEVVSLGDCNCDVKTAKSKLTKYIEEEIKKARIEELTKFTQYMNAIRVDDGFVPIEYTYIRKRLKDLGEH
jgi:hypothetical protein